MLTGNLDDWVILDVMAVLWRPQGSYPESFVLISLLEVCQESSVFMVVLEGHCRFLTGDLDERVIFDVMDVLGRPQGSYPESFVLISLLEV